MGARKAPTPRPADVVRPPAPPAPPPGRYVRESDVPPAPRVPEEPSPSFRIGYIRVVLGILHDAPDRVSKKRRRECALTALRHLLAIEKLVLGMQPSSLVDDSPGVVLEDPAPKVLDLMQALKDALR